MTTLFVCVNTSIIIHYHWYSHNENDKLSFDMPFSTPSVLRFFNFISFNRENGAKEVHERDEPHRGSAFDSPGLASVASYPGLICCVGTQRRRCCAFLISSTGILNTKIWTHSYSKKTQHRWRCSFAYICRQGNSLRSPTLPYKERNPRGVHSPPQPYTIRNNENHIGGNFSFKRESGAKR